MSKIKKKVKTIRVDTDRCNGCRGCEIVCSGFHATPQYSSNNPARARIRVLTHRLKNIWLPVFAGDSVATECQGRSSYVIAGREYDECSFCRAACPSRNLFKEPDSGLPLKCDMCEGEEKPKCVEWCLNNVLIYEEREEEIEDEINPMEVDFDVESLVKRYGLEKVGDVLARQTVSDKK